MQFCPKCKSIILPVKKAGRTVMKCSSCNFTSKKKENIILKEEIKLAREDKIEIIDKNVSTLPKTDAECQKCHHDQAYYWLVQTRAADEAPTRFFRCVKCSHTWRENR